MNESKENSPTASNVVFIPAVGDMLI